MLQRFSKVRVSSVSWISQMSRIRVSRVRVSRARVSKVSRVDLDGSTESMLAGLTGILAH